MPVLTKIEELRLYQFQFNNIRNWGLVTTMGSLHKGHLQLIEKSSKENSLTFVTIFVNPLQFDNKMDLENYPSSIDIDLQKIEEIDKNICVFVPSVETVYPNGATLKKFSLHGLDKHMEGKKRPGHFDGVATVVERLFEIIKPNVAYFGQKDFQQLQIVSTIAKSMGIRIRSIPTVRERNGLAMSSRNYLLTPTSREEAKMIFDILKFVKANFSSFSIFKLKNIVIEKISKNPNFELDYFEIADEHSLQITDSKEEGVNYRAFIAVVVDGVRLIDNMSLI